MEYVKDQLAEVREAVALAEKASGRAPGEVKLMAVSKTFPPEAVVAAYEAGQRIFGENRVQELETKVPILPSDIEWHLIGHLQSNKAPKATTLAAYIHSVDSVKLLSRLDKLAEESGARPKILLELNISGEESKFGMTDEKESMALADVAVKCKNIDFVGLMTMAAFGAENGELRRVFSGLRLLRDKMQSEFDVKLPELSMGMSSDYKIAIEEGSTFVRIGTAIFGKRNYAV